MFTERNRQQIEAHGLTEAEVERQLEIFKHGIPFAHVVGSVSINNGIRVFSESEQKKYVDLFESQKDNLDLLKFVPASGAATRMFKSLHRFLEIYDPKMDIEKFLQEETSKDLKIFFDSFEHFAFADLVLKRLKSKHKGFDDLKKGKKYLLIIKEMLGEDALNFGFIPKGLIPFHKHDKEYITAFEEQLYEAAFYATSNNVANLHFTVSVDHKSKFKKRHEKIQHLVEKRTNTEFYISYSFQKKETDTIAATLDNELFLDENGNIVFRPSGHGALLQNLNEMDADIIFIKNIDNVVSQKYVETIAFQKKVLAGKLISLQMKIFEHIEKLEKESLSNKIIQDASHFISEELKLTNVGKNKEALLNILNRPIRICGVVENTGAPGGGPFIVKNKKGEIFHQIVEISQIDMHNPEQKAFVDSATHFNPVDLVCGVRNYKGEKFDLNQFADPDAGFISEKSYNGIHLKALERPGLWNGAMDNWNTVFVEVPLITFNPVKTVNDLLNEVHLS
ncbi:DUF4301 family protein [Aequorivita sp. H23M31]|uniref:DUF4301 family protein n=1 Tax=Aequorivita ciconiae TaxID=2494375 RepID=A0A410G3M3_9FLAO|nr:DUF4301 family protein [Aequorivita sp. H23M31]QAA81874.1 DUF4301 family protein [Aequorivita sp. H23M31]